jgi:hypothetical protein
MSSSKLSVRVGSTMLAGALSLVAAGALLADHAMVRTRDNPQTFFQGEIWVTVTLRPGYWEQPGHPHVHGAHGAHGAPDAPAAPVARLRHDDDHPTPPSPTPPPSPQPPVYHPPITRDQRVRFTLTIQGPAPLRLGEVEQFRVHGDHSWPDRHIDLRLGGDTIWEYRGSTRERVPVEFMARDHNHPVVAAFTLTPVRRQRIVPPNVIQSLRAGTDPAADSLVVQFDDPGLADDGGATTTYLVELKRMRPLWFDKTIARGEVPAAPGVAQRLVIARGGPLHVAQDEWLKEGTKYSVSVRVKKTSPEYEPDPSDESRIQFKHRAAGGAASARELRREALFAELHARGGARE